MLVLPCLVVFCCCFFLSVKHTQQGKGKKGTQVVLFVYGVKFPPCRHVNVSTTFILRKIKSEW